MADLDCAVVELRSTGVPVAEPVENDRHRYAHFVAPDGELYELVQQRRTADSGGGLPQGLPTAVVRAERALSQLPA